MEKRQKDAVIIGFDSAWGDKTPGAICAIRFDRQGHSSFLPPELVSFSEAYTYIERIKSDFSLCLVALDQPTIVPNVNGSRPVDRMAASVISYVGGGVQPANRSKVELFGDNAPIRKFESRLGALENPENAKRSQAGLFLMEVFPALALTGLNDAFAGRFGAPKYNPANRKTFRLNDWQAVAATTAQTAASLGVTRLAEWARAIGQYPKPRKPDQDRLDAALCALVGLIWRACGEDNSMMIGDVRTGYMVTPVSPQTRQRLERAEARQSQGK